MLSNKKLHSRRYAEASSMETLVDVPERSLQCLSFVAIRKFSAAGKSSVRAFEFYVDMTTFRVFFFLLRQVAEERMTGYIVVIT